MWPDGDARTVEVGRQPFLHGHWREWRLVVRNSARNSVLLRQAPQQRPRGTAGIFHLPESIAAMDVFSQRIQRADLGQHGEIVLAQLGNAQREIVNGIEGTT